MTTQTFPAGEAPQVILAGCAGTLTIESWGERAIAVDTKAIPDRLEQAGAALIIGGAQGDLHLRVPADAQVSVLDQRGNVAVRAIDGCALERIAGDLRLERLAGAIRLRDIYGRSLIDGADALAIAPDTRPRPAEGWGGARREIEVYNTRIVDIAEAADNLTVAGAQRATIGAVGRNAHVRDIAGDLRLGPVGGAAQIEQIAGAAQIEAVGGQAELRDIGALTHIDSVGGSLNIAAVPLAIDRARLSVGGNAAIELPADADLTVHAIAGGVIRGPGVGATRTGGMATIRYGAGTTRLDLTVGGSLELRGEPTTTNQAKPSARSTHEQREEILRMVAAGRLSPEQAERRLSDLDG